MSGVVGGLWRGWGVVGIHTGGSHAVGHFRLRRVKGKRWINVQRCLRNTTTSSRKGSLLLWSGRSGLGVGSSSLLFVPFFGSSRSSQKQRSSCYMFHSTQEKTKATRVACVRCSRLGYSMTFFYASIFSDDWGSMSNHPCGWNILIPYPYWGASEKSPNTKPSSTAHRRPTASPLSPLFDRRSSTRVVGGKIRT